jgi:2-keto-4-pentenoate hydratase/2-oxohepta-3-ene-1,7-dioic acid hydratase in catechol pathway
LECDYKNSLILEYVEVDMKIARFIFNNEVAYGCVEGEKINKIEGNIFGSFRVTDQEYDFSKVKLLPPVDPPNIIAIGLNYKEHSEESNMKLPERPVIFLKATTSITGHEDNIVLPKIAPDEVDYEAELAVVIGKKAKDVEEEDALEYVLGYTCGNDVSARDCQLKQDAQWARGKSFDTFCPIGPFIVTDIDTDNLSISTRLNGMVVQKSNTSNMIFTVEKLVSYCSKNMTLLPGTIIMTGTPEGVGFARKPQIFMKVGDIVEVEIENIGILRNRVI